jgi:hypothetical protein
VLPKQKGQLLAMTCFYSIEKDDNWVITDLSLPMHQPGTRLTNVPPEPLAWSLTRAAREFGTPKTTLGAKLKAGGENPDSSGLFSTTQLVRVIYGSIFAERSRLIREQADRIALENKITRAEYLDREALKAGLALAAEAIVQIIRNSKLSREEQEDIQRNIANIPLALAAVGERQSRLRSKGEKADSHKGGRGRN